MRKRGNEVGGRSMSEKGVEMEGGGVRERRSEEGKRGVRERGEVIEDRGRDGDKNGTGNNKRKSAGQTKQRN